MTTYLQRHADAAAAEMGDDVQASITFRHHGALVRAASSSSGAAVCDQVEARGDDGPCIVAMSLLEQVVVPDIGGERRWPVWTRRALGEAFRSFVAVPATVDPVTAVALNLYSGAPRTWDAADRDRAQRRVTAVATDVRDRLAASEATGRTVGAQHRPAEHEVVDQAVGVVMHANGCDPRTARALLEMVAVRRDAPLADVAAVLLATVAPAV